MPFLSDRYLEHPDITSARRDGYPTPLFPPAPVYECSCDAKFDPGNEIYAIDGDRVCEECFIAWAKDYVSSNPKEVADALCVEHERWLEGA